MSHSQFQSIKITLVSVTSLSRDALHIYVGMALYLGASWLLRRSRHRWIPWAVVLVAASVGELLDARDDLAGRNFWRWEDSFHDLVNTLFWPTVIALLLRWTSLFARPELPQSGTASTSARPE